MASSSRQVVDSDNPNLLIAESKRNPYVPDKALKARVLSALCHIHEQAAICFLVVGEMYNLTVLPVDKSPAHNASLSEAE